MLSAVTLAGCTGAPHPAATDSAAPSTFTADDLVDVLDRTGTTLGVDGTLVTDQQLKDAADELGGSSGLIDFLGLRDVAYSPQVCGTLITDGLAGGVPKDAIAAQFRAGATTITVASFADRALTSSERSAWTTTADDALEKCSKVMMSFEVSGTTMSATATMKKTDAHTGADQTVGLEQTMSFTYGDKAVSSVSSVVQAASGNLLISAISTRTDQTSDVEAQETVVSPTEAVDAVVTVVRQGWHR
jgi:hypothetical protein